VRRLKQELDRDGIKSKLRMGKLDQRCGGRPFSRGALYQLLSNPLYIGEIRHKGICHPGQHEAILDRNLWDRTQRQLREGGATPRPRRVNVGVSLLAGKLFDESGERLTPSHAVKNGRRYRYYVSRRLVTGTRDRQPGWRLPANEIERAVAVAVSEILGDRNAVVTTLRLAGVAPRGIPAALETTACMRASLLKDTGALATIGMLVDRIELQAESIQIRLSLRAVLPEKQNSSEGPHPAIARSIPLQIGRRGQQMRLVIESGVVPQSKIDIVLVKTIARAFRWFEDLATGRVTLLSEIARRDGVTARYVGRMLPLALLAPEVVEAICAGRQLPHMTAKSLIGQMGRLPAEWDKQLKAYSCVGRG